MYSDVGLLHVMLKEIELHRCADVLLWRLKTSRKGRYGKDDIVLIQYELAAVKMAEILQAKLLDMGMNQVVLMGFTSQMERNFFEKANKKQLVFQIPGQRELYEKLDGTIYLHAPESLIHLSHLDPKKIGKAAIARKPLRDILRKREGMGSFGWTLCMLPTLELANKAGISMK